MNMDLEYISIDKETIEELEKIPFLSINELEENTKILIIKINNEIAAVRAYQESYPFTNKLFFADHIKEDEILKSEIRNIFYNATRFKGLDLTSDAIRKKLEELKQELNEDANLQPANSNQSLEFSQDINLISEKIKWLEFLLECKIKQEAEKQKMEKSQEGRRH